MIGKTPEYFSARCANGLPAECSEMALRANANDNSEMRLGATPPARRSETRQTQSQQVIELSHKE